MTKVIDQKTGQEIDGKTCTKCGEWKELKHYHKASSRRLGVKSDCKECNKAWRIENGDRLRKKSREWIAKFRLENPELAAELTKKWREDNPEKLRNSRRKSQAKINDTKRGRLSNAVSTGIHRGIKKGSKYGRSTFALLGYSLDELMVHLERQFLPGMTWENYGEWHIDHIVPIAAHNYETPDDLDFRRAWSLKNLRPLWGTENLSKGARLLNPFQPSLCLAATEMMHANDNGEDEDESTERA